MRVVSPQELLAAPLPPELRPGSKIAVAYTGVRTSILEGGYQAGQVLIPRQIEEQYNISNTSVQLILMRLAIEGLVKVHPIRERSNASFNEYRIADLSMRNRMLSDRRGARNAIARRLFASMIVTSHSGLPRLCQSLRSLTATFTS